MSRFDEYFLMDEVTVVDYVKEKFRDMFNSDAKLVGKEIGDGNLNYVFRVKDEDTQKSVIVKQAGPELRISKDFDISTDRNRIEVGALQVEGKLSPGLVAEIYLYDPVMKSFTMEDLSDYAVMRTALMKHEIFPRFAEDISTFMVNTLLLTTDRVMDSKEKKEMVKEYVNPQLCADISEALVYTEPYNDNVGRNKVFPPNKEFVEKELYNDQALHLEVAKLKYDFMNNAQSLIHGDLHTGSIFVRKDATKIMDPEFAFYGPMGYDIGNVVANMIFAWANGDATINDAAEKEKYLSWVEEVITQVIDLFIQKYKVAFDKKVTEPMAKTPGYKEYFLETILSDSAGVTGIEIIRRVVGLAQVKDVTTIENETKRMQAERMLILAAKEFIKNRQSFQKGSDFLACVKKYAIQEK